MLHRQAGCYGCICAESRSRTEYAVITPSTAVSRYRYRGTRTTVPVPRGTRTMIYDHTMQLRASFVAIMAAAGGGGGGAAPRRGMQELANLVNSPGVGGKVRRSSADRRQTATSVSGAFGEDSDDSNAEPAAAVAQRSAQAR